MKRLILLVILSIATANLAFADQNYLIRKIDLPMGKNFEGITVNPTTHKAYVIGELATEGADDDKAVFVINSMVLAGKSAPKVIHIPYETEYAAVDPIRNLIYLSTKYSVEAPETDNGTAGEVVLPGQPVVHLGTLTVIDGYTDSVLTAYTFDAGIQPEGVAVDPATGIVYVGAKAPEGESSNVNICNAWATPIPDVADPGDVECWTSGHIYAFSFDAVKKAVTLLKDIPAGDDPESVAFANRMIYAANEDDGTVTIATAVNRDGSGGALLTDWPIPPSQPYEAGIAPYSLGVFYGYGPNPLACTENKFEADKMVAGGGSVFITDDRSRVAKIKGTAVVGMRDVPGATICENIPDSDGGGKNSANNIGFMPAYAGLLYGDLFPTLYVVSEQDTVTLLNAGDSLEVQSVVTVPGAVHLDAIGVDPAANRVWLTDEGQQSVFMLQRSYVNWTGYTY
ncbi:hypothetical protein [Geotalea sp. SG265]|uniref:YncE family protein n=1 Tax=Geotalea sp. SG265 TaxID=2922867 RepID=UPI001FAFA7E9|nr:hypothetical protein [Geotalea sp. SG265]